MPETITYKLIAPTIGTDSEWLAKDDTFILPKGVLGTVLDRQYSGQVEFIVGDGSSKYSELVKVGVTLPTENATNGALLTTDGTGKLVFVSKVNASMLDGVISAENLPKSAVATLKVVANQRERFALTIDDVQNGDVVKQEDTGALYFVKDDTQLNSEAGYEPYTSGVAGSVAWSGITDKPTTLSGYGITDAMTSTQINEELAKKQPIGNYVTAETLEGTYVTNENLTSALSTKQNVGDYATKTDLTNGLNGKANSVHTHVKADITDFPTDLATQTDLANKADKSVVDELNNNAVKYSLYDNRKFIQMANHDALSGVTTTGDGVNIAMVSKWDKVDLGSAKVTMNLNTVDNITINDDKVIATQDFVGEQVATKADLVHTHTKADITDFPTKLSEFENDLAPIDTGAVRWDEIQNKPESFTPSAHTHTVSDVTDFPSDLVHEAALADYATKTELESKLDSADLEQYALKSDIPEQLPNPNALTIKYNNVQAFTYDGSKAETGNFTVTLQTVPVAVTSEGAPTSNAGFPANSVVKVNSAGTMLTTATAGTDYVAPNGNVASATKLQTARTIGLSGVGSTPQTFDGTTNISIPITNVPYSLVSGAPTIPTKTSELENDSNFLTNVSWANISDKPTTVSGYGITDAVDSNTLNSSLSGKANVSHTHTKEQITDFPTDLVTNDTLANYVTNGTFTTALSGKADSVHTHTKDQITDFPTDLVQYSLYDNRKFIQMANHDALSGVTTGGEGVNLVMVSKWDKADFGSPKITMNLNTVDNVTINDDEIIATQTYVGEQVATKANVVHTHVKADITDFPTKLSEFENDLTAPEVESISWEKITGKPESFAPSAHTHTVSDVTDFPSDLVHEAALADYATKTLVNENSINNLTITRTTNESPNVVFKNGDSELGKITVPYMAFTPQTSFVDKELASFYGDLGGAPTYYNMQEWDSYLSSNEDGISSVNDLTAENGPYLVLTASNYEDDSTIELAQYVTSLKKIMPDISGKADIADTLAGYGITDAYTKTETDEAIEDVSTIICDFPINTFIPYQGNNADVDKIYSKDTILGWFGVTTESELNSLINTKRTILLRYGITLSGSNMYYRMPINYLSFENSAKTKLKMVIIGLNIYNDITYKFTVTMNLDETILIGNSNIKFEMTNLENRPVYHVGESAPDNTNLLWLDSTNNQIKYYDGSDWQVFSLGA